MLVGAALTESHTGALAGSDAAFDAVFDAYGVQRVDDMDELATTLMMLAQPHPVGSGGLGHAARLRRGNVSLRRIWPTRFGVPMTELDAATVTALENVLDPGLLATNPLDAWSAGGPNAEDVMAESLTIMLQDPQAAMGAVVHDRVAYGDIYPPYVDYLRRAHRATGKPGFLVSARQGTGHDPRVVEVTREGFPVIDGVRPFLVGARALLEYRDFAQRSDSASGALPSKACKRLAQPSQRGQGDRRCPRTWRFCVTWACPWSRRHRAARPKRQWMPRSSWGYPVVLKTGAEHAHKTDVGGIFLHLASAQDVHEAYETLRDIDVRVTVSPMVAEPGVEMLLGIVNDHDFGPIVILGAGGVHAEATADTVALLPPFGAATALRRLSTLRIWPVLQQPRIARRLDLDGFAAMAERLSLVATEFADIVRDIDINPVIVHENGCVGVDALVTKNVASRAHDREAPAGDLPPVHPYAVPDEVVG